MLDTLIAGGRIATAGGLVEADIGLRDGRVAALLRPGEAAASRERVSAAGLVVLPGLVDAHVHFRDPGLTHKEDFTSGTAAAAAGGVTAALVMPTDLPPTWSAAEFEAKRALAAGRLHVDVGLQALAVEAGPVAALAAAGAVSVEVFLGDMPAALMPRDDAALAAIAKAARDAGIVLGINPADDDVIAEAEARLLALRPRPASDPLDFFHSRPTASEARGVARALAVAAGAALHIRQITCRDSLALLRGARDRGQDVTAETMPHYLLLDEVEIRRQGPFAKILPPMRQEAERAALWDALRDGTLDMVATDHAPHALAEKLPGLQDIWAAPGGFPGVQTLLPLMLSAVAEGRIGWADLVRLCCEAPARRFGLWPRKGHLTVGADADLVLVDPGRRGAIRNADQLSRAGRTPFDGWPTTGWPVATWLRGACVAREGAPPSDLSGVVLGRTC